MNEQIPAPRASRPSLFWPIILIGVGVVGLLANFNIIEPLSLLTLVRLWPLVLVALGLHVIFSHRFPWMGVFLLVVLVVIGIAAVLFAPLLDLQPTTQLVSETFEEAIGNASSAVIELNIDRGSLDVSAGAAPGVLFQADSMHDMHSRFDIIGEDEKTVSLTLETDDIFDWFGSLGDQRVETNVLLSPSLPLSLDISHGSGRATLDLTGLNLLGVMTSTGSGSLSATLPAGTYPAEISAGSGELSVEVAPEAVLELRADVGSGRVTIQLGSGVSGSIDVDAGSGIVTIVVPAGIGIRLEGETGSGRVTLPDGYEVVEGGEDGFSAGVEGIWQSPGYESAAVRLVITFDVGSGLLRVVEATE